MAERTSGQPRGPQGVIPREEVRAGAAAVHREQGEGKAVQIFGVSRGALARVIGGLHVRAGTLALVERGLATLASPRSTEAA
jgi:hypothetical protein